VGGYEVAEPDRKPGDIQQRLDVKKDGNYSGLGHSSVVHGVAGYGIAKLGAGRGSPTIEGEVKGPKPAAELAEGWYEIKAGSGLKWVIGPDTDPSCIADLHAETIQLIDANTVGSSKEGKGNRDGDATAIGDFQQGKENAEMSAGRLPSSDWFAWATGSEEVIAVLSTTAPEGAASNEI
jgi:hypothetical protein